MLERGFLCYPQAEKEDFFLHQQGCSGIHADGSEKKGKSEILLPLYLPLSGPMLEQFSGLSLDFFRDPYYSVDSQKGEAHHQIQNMISLTKEA